MKGSKRKIIDSQIFETAANLGPYLYRRRPLTSLRRQQMIRVLPIHGPGLDDRPLPRLELERVRVVLRHVLVVLALFEVDKLEHDAGEDQDDEDDGDYGRDCDDHGLGDGGLGRVTSFCTNSTRSSSLFFSRICTQSGHTLTGGDLETIASLQRDRSLMPRLNVETEMV